MPTAKKDEPKKARVIVEVESDASKADVMNAVHAALSGQVRLVSATSVHRDFRLLDYDRVTNTMKARARANA